MSTMPPFEMDLAVDAAFGRWQRRLRAAPIGASQSMQKSSPSSARPARMRAISSSRSCSTIASTASIMRSETFIPAANASPRGDQPGGVFDKDVVVGALHHDGVRTGSVNTRGATGRGSSIGGAGTATSGAAGARTASVQR
jgi:hypothetical protein